MSWSVLEYLALITGGGGRGAGCSAFAIQVPAGYILSQSTELL